jgi:hypothetical protein
MGALDGKALVDRDALDGGDRGARGGEARGRSIMARRGRSIGLTGPLGLGDGSLVYYPR